jgi:hypothetical protein
MTLNRLTVFTSPAELRRSLRVVGLTLRFGQDAEVVDLRAPCDLMFVAGVPCRRCRRVTARWPSGD